MGVYYMKKILLLLVLCLGLVGCGSKDLMSVTKTELKRVEDSKEFIFNLTDNIGKEYKSTEKAEIKLKLDKTIDELTELVDKTHTSTGMNVVLLLRNMANDLQSYYNGEKDLVEEIVDLQISSIIEYIDDPAIENHFLTEEEKKDKLD